MIKGLAVFSMLAVAAVMAAGCTVHEAASAPSLTGPSQFAVQVIPTANPDRISLDGASRSLITAEVRDQNGQLKANVPLHVDMLPNGSFPAYDYGKLNASNIVTGTDGKAFAVYTAPALAAGANQTVFTVSIRIIVVGTDASDSVTHTAIINLFPQGVILPPADTPSPSFVVTPTPVNLNVAVSFDASASCPGAKNATGCLPSSSAVITNYAWSFGDGATSSGKTVNHTYASTGTFNATLTITNDRGVTASTSQSVVVSLTPPPSATFTFSPSPVGINQTVFFTAASSKPSAGRTIASYAWEFGDGTSGSGVTITHAYAAAGLYEVTLTVTDDIGQATTTTNGVTVTPVAGGVFASFIFSPTAPIVGTVVNFNASASTGAVRYDWDFGDGTMAPGLTVPTTSHMFTAPGTYVVRLLVSDAAVGGHTNATTQPVSVGATPPPPVPAPPTPNFVFSPQAPHAGDIVFFTNTSTTPSGGAFTSSWDFGDGFTCPATCGTGTSTNPTHTYLAGPATTTRNVVLTVRDSTTGLTATKALTVTITTP